MKTLFSLAVIASLATVGFAQETKPAPKKPEACCKAEGQGKKDGKTCTHDKKDGKACSHEKGKDGACCTKKADDSKGTKKP